jgi:hypothetical protein
MAWLINRLRTMPPAEIVSRIADVARHMSLRLSLQRVQAGGIIPVRDRFASFELPSLNGHLTPTPAHVKQRVIEAANKWLEHRANFFSLCDAPLGETINWHCDYSSGVTAPIKYSGLVNYRNVTVAGDVKYIWELNRLQQLVSLALAMAWTGNETYGKEIERQTLSWQSQNPFMMGLNWKSPLEAGMRLISWAYVLFLTSGSHLDDIYPNTSREVIYQHQYFIKKFYSKNSSANNHLIGEMVGLYVGAVFWPHYRESAGWRAFARRKLIQEMFRQVEADGVGKERATEYQAFVIELFLMAGALGHLIADPFPQEYWDRLKGMLRFLSVICNRTGHLPIFGDGDSAQAVWLPATTPERICDLVQLSRLDQPNPLNSNLRSRLLLWGQAPQEIPIGPVKQSTENLEIFPEGGYYVLASDRGDENEIVTIFDAGPLGLSPLNAHGHADALSLWLSYGGQEFLIDPGTYCYHRSPVWRSYFRGTAAHNTIRVDGEDQSVPGGTFLWLETADCRVQRFDHTEEFIEVIAFHDGYRRLRDPVIHKRGLRLFKKSRTLVITDRLECQGVHDIELFFHFSEKCQVRQVGSRSFEASNRRKRISIRVDSRLNPELYRGCEKPIFGWVSRSFGVKEPCFTLVARVGITGSTEFLTEITAL